MTALKKYKANTSAHKLKDYLESEGRALGMDFYNMTLDERQLSGLDATQAKDSFEWDKEMDELRQNANSEKRAYGKAGYLHYVISPSPIDHVGLSQLRQLTKQWVLGFYENCPIAIAYHDDNTNGIMHAHVIVNNFDLQAESFVKPVG
ncbi:MAG: relaxase/mobilization nuclease domain-containing protein [Eggerthellaceae bacterium]|nr:relaxase/mobilization nuclease domain-containing protein [Eggerthellaceae bacterium]